MKVKLSDIAEKMNLSVAAISMAINNKPGVSDETRLEVLKVAKEMGYKIKRQSQTAQNHPSEKKFIKLLRIKKHGLVLMETAFFTAVIDGLEEECRKLGYELLIANITLDSEHPNQIKDEFHDDVEGLIALCTELDEKDIDGLLKIKCPKVIMDRRFEDNIDTVLMNNQKASRQAVSYFYEHGHRDIGYLKSNRDIYNFGSRFRSYLKAMSSLDLPVQPEKIIELEPTIEGAARDMGHILASIKGKDLPTAFLADNDNIALGAMRAMSEKGIKVPEDVSIIGIDDMPFCTLVKPQLTTIRIYKKEIGRQAVKMLHDQIIGDVVCSKKVEIDTVLVERESVLSR